MSEQPELTEEEFVRQYRPEAYRRPTLTTDILALTFHNGKINVLLIQRRGHPHQGRWALPGGFVEFGEKPELSARRELMEETGIHARWLRLLGAYGAPERDPRTHIVSLIYYTVIPFSRLRPRAGDDAGDVRWFNLYRLPRLAFDHNRICRDMRRRLPLEILDVEFAKKFVGHEQIMEKDLLGIYQLVYGAKATPSRLRRLARIFDRQKTPFPASIFSSF